ncbi:ATPase [Fusarium albosuccineum]|uniref:ATPase n=1 Tax=Fusarium albosuccineum TaxID=1237068 RepID=A0A8H4LBS4_9HYPO|nr:ATPase [Fusarium albosuccineum]
MDSPEPHSDDSNCPPPETQPPDPASGTNGPWVRYRVEYRSVTTNELVAQKSTRDSLDRLWSDEDAHNESWPVFEVVKTIKVQDTEPKKSRHARTRPSIPLAPLAPSCGVRIYSANIINAIQSVVKYYPGQDLTGDSVLVEWPYPILVHHYEKLEGFLSEVNKLAPDKRCSRERNVNEHLRLLLDYLDDNVMPGVREEQERNARGFYTFQWLWVSMKPGETLIAQLKGHSEPSAMVIHSLEGGIFANPSQPWKVRYWRMNFNGECLGREMGTSRHGKWDGEIGFQSYRRFLSFTEKKDGKIPDDLESDDVIRRFLCRGETYWKLLTKQCQWYSGETADFPYNQIDTNVMIDVEACLVGGHMEKPSLMRNQDLPQLYIHNLSEPRFNHQMIDSLVMDTVQLRRLRALTQSFARIDKDGNQLANEAWSADFVKGKGQGLIFLLHGRPGVESIAEFLRKPLMILTCSDIGIDPVEVERNLTREFKKAKSWGAVLLIDEADVFMERRSTKDLTRNSLVAGFLRALEFYDGILFLTTNRVGAFDDAFISRIHIQLYYPEFTDDQRQQVWQTFVDKLKRDCGSYMKLDSTAKSYLKSKEVRAMKWNGRDIRNAFQTAVSLAEYDAEKDDDGKVLVTDDHFRAVVELSSDFRKYLDTLHKKDEAQRAAFKHERYDEFAKDGE